MKVGLVTVTFNSAQVLEGFLTSVMSQDNTEWALYVVDNASADATRQMIERAAEPRIHPVWNDRNVGVAAGNNAGMARAWQDGCDAVLLINNDTEFGPDLVSGLLEAMQQTGADLITPKISVHGSDSQLWFAGGRLEIWRGYAARHFGIWQRDRGAWDQTKRISYAPTCCMLIRRQVFERVGPLDERLFVYCDDLDLCLRVRPAGLTLWYAPSRTLSHKVSSLTGGTSEFSLQMMTRGRVYVIRKFAAGWAVPYHCAMVLAEIAARVVLRNERIEQVRARLRGFREGFQLPVDQAGVARD